MKTTLTFKLSIILSAVLLGAQGCSTDPPASTGQLEPSPSASQQATEKHLVAIDDNGLAVQGYDTVAFFTDSKPVEGSDEFTYEHHGAEWRFASAKNLAAFKADPEKYAPAYGGYCAWGVGEKNDLFPIEIDRWKIVDGRLYLNYNAEVQQSWLADVPGFIEKADANWPQLVASQGK